MKKTDVGRGLTPHKQQDGGFDAIIHTGLTAMTPHNAMTEPFIVATRSLYSAKSFKLKVDTVKLTMVANTFMRAPGEAVGTFALESAIDELAAELGIDPIELRIRNEPEKDPTQGLPFSQRGIVGAWRSGAERFGWAKRIVAPRSRREGDWFVGLGCATGTYPYYRMPGGAARITLSRDGGATVSVAAHEMGMGTATVQTQVAADRLGLSMDRVEFRYGDTSFPGVVLAGGSQQTASIGAGVAAAHRALVTELLKLAGNDSPLAGLHPNDVGGLDGGLGSLEDPERRETYASILERAQRAEVTVEADAYHVPVHLDVPAIEVMWSDEPDPRAPMGARGIGEIGITGVGAAVANAVFNATGKRVRELPITLDKTL